MLLPMLTTKVKIPSSRGEIVTRNRLIERLNTNPNRKLTLVSAPAGFGKTTLVSAWLRQVTLPVTWYALEPTDNDPVQFFSYLIFALQQVYSDIGAGLVQRLNSPDPPASTLIIAQLINEIALRDEPAILVLDDLHIIDDNEIWQALQFLCNSQFELLHLVIITREDPPLPLSRLRARGEMVEIRTQDLRFTLDEAGCFLSQVMAIHLTQNQLVALDERTDGWIAGLQLAALSIREVADTDSFIESFSGSHRFILDYLTDEVLKQLPAGLRRFLLKTSILERLTAPLCNAVTEREDSQAILQHIEEMNLFLIPLDHRREWYRYHHLFAEMMRKQLSQEFSDEIVALHHRASQWYEEQGSLAESIHHAQEAHQIDRLADLIERYSLGIIKQGHIRTGRYWLERLPVDIRLKRPRLQMNYAWALFLSRDYKPLPALLDHLEDSPPVSAAIMGEASALRAFLAVDNPGQMQEYALHALDIIPEDNMMVRGLVHMGLANVHRRFGQKAAAYEQFAKAIPLHWAAGNQVAAMMASLDLVQDNASLGWWKRTYQLCQDLLALAEADGSLEQPASGLVYLGIGTVLLHWFRLDQAMAAIERGTALLDTSGYSVADYDKMLRMQAHIALQNRPQAMALLEQLVGQQVTGPDTIKEYRILWMAHGFLLLHEVERAGQLLERIVVKRDEWYRLNVVRYQLEVALLQQDARQRESVLETLADLIDQAQSNQWDGVLVEALNLRAIAQPDIELALNDLSMSLDVALPEQELFLFVKDRHYLEALLKQLPNHPHARAILAVFESQNAQPPVALSHPELVEALSAREIEIVQRMTRGLTYQAIANELVISVNTVRYHVKSLYGKLGVSSRADAIARARDLDFLA